MRYFTLLALALLGACASTPLLGRAFFDARDKWVEGTLVAVERQEDYEQPCRLFCRLTGRGGDVPRAYLATVVDAENRKTYFMFFAPAGNRIPLIGTRAQWRLRPTDVVNFARCFSYGCPHEFVYALHSDEDVRP